MKRTAIKSLGLGLGLLVSCGQNGTNEEDFVSAPTGSGTNGSLAVRLAPER